MTATPPAATPPASSATDIVGGPVVHLAHVLRRPVTDRDGHTLGNPVDVIARLRAEGYPLVSGLVLAVGGRRLFVPVEQVDSLDEATLTLSSARVDLRPFERRPGEVLLGADVLGHRLIDLRDARLVRARDIELAHHRGQWLVARVEVDQRGWWRRLLGRPQPPHAGQDWKAFEPLVGPEHRAVVRAVSGLGRLKVAQIADLLEEASAREKTDILATLRGSPELEADVFEELDEEHASRLLGERTDAEIAAVLARMQADDAADAIAELPQQRRQAVLDLVPTHQRVKIRMLLGFNPSSAGGLMSVDFLALPVTTTAADALAAVRPVTGIAPEALTSVHALDEAGRLCGVMPLVRLVQTDPAAVLREVADTDPVRVGPDTDVVDVVLLMSDHNLLTLPVVDTEGHMIGILTVDDVLETTVPADWRRREPPAPPDIPRPKLEHHSLDDSHRGPTEAGHDR